MISVKEAQEHLFNLATPMGTESVPLEQANGRVLGHDVIAQRDQPPFSSSAMDGYAIANESVSAGDMFHVIGEAAAGHRFQGSLLTGQAVRIFTGAPVPEGTTRILIQEDVERLGDKITLCEGADSALYIRPAGGDFMAGHVVHAGTVLPMVDVVKKPVVALMSTGDELVLPGETPQSDQIVASNAYGLAALLKDGGAETRVLPIARDTLASLRSVFDLAKDADLIVTIGGASVGDHDLVAEASANMGMEQSFYKVAMRPGKPLMAGRFNNHAMVGLPGNPVSAMVCGHVFLVPMIKKMLGLSHILPETIETTLLNDIPANGPRTHYCRAMLSPKGLFVAERQDSSLLTILASANALAIREPNASSAKAGERVKYIPL
ncbi:MAG: molybdopterin molybdotransferase MoeA [Paracoccaceae bacterium]